MQAARRRSSLDRMTDRELLLLLNERLEDHLALHAWWTTAYRWTVVLLVAGLAAAAAWFRK